ncbi:MAG TPA: hypothetical protein VJ689_07100 [Gaiellaceae bacterium]|nr:hypothetical protein [Gaiellaceae bacterium]
MRTVVPQVWIAVAGVALTFLGVSRPWSRRSGIVSDSVSGLDTEDGKYIALLSLVAAALLVLHIVLSRGKRVLAAVMIAGTVIALIALLNLIEISSKVDDTGSDFVHGSVGWGVYATVLGGLGIAVGSIWTLAEISKPKAEPASLPADSPAELKQS